MSAAATSTAFLKLNFHELPQSDLPRPDEENKQERQNSSSNGRNSKNGSVESSASNVSANAKATDKEEEEEKKDDSPSKAAGRPRMNRLPRLPPIPSPRSMTVRLAKYQSYKVMENDARSHISNCFNLTISFFCLGCSCCL
jgi:hypothetical protein